MSKQILLALLVSSLSVLVFSETTPEPDGCPTYIGEAYYVQNSTFADWFEANVTCARCGYRLAESHSKVHLDFKHGALSGVERYDYWIGARESRNNYQYLAWDQSGNTLGDGVFDTFVGAYTAQNYHICGALETKYDYQQNWIVLKHCLELKPYLCDGNFLK